MGQWYICIYVMSRTVTKTFTLPLPVAKRLEEEQNQSGTVARCLIDHYEMEVEA